MNAIVSRMFQAQYVDSVVTIVEMYGVSSEIQFLGFPSATLLS